MEKISLPAKIDIKEGDSNQGIATIQPCYPGYGMTIGNALRRVLLSSLPGAAVIAFKIKGVQHEFSTVPGIKEDLIEIMMNLKQLSLKVHSEEPIELTLEAKGSKKVKAGDIKKNSSVEVVNKDLVICNLTEKNAELEMKIWVERGLGYIPVEEKKDEKSEIGAIQIDAVYTPIQKVGLSRENVRVGERTDYDKLILDIETDGTITVNEAIEQAAKTLVEQFECVAGLGDSEETSNHRSSGGGKKLEIRDDGGEIKSGEKEGVEDDDEAIESEEDVKEKIEKKSKAKKQTKAKKV